ncbi:hypothetical protein [Sutterella sp.]|uniref:hypothetical protein n=1 Tax=Sutterella sp. TaxID=1981025 RepID=UPI0026E07DB8|nr:hypothetical protein [Sutterella sp.]MDO5532877.1 hypothetical protein [Sutterella sp.]
MRKLFFPPRESDYFLFEMDDYERDRADWQSRIEFLGGVVIVFITIVCIYIDM